MSQSPRTLAIFSVAVLLTLGMASLAHASVLALDSPPDQSGPIVTPGGGRGTVGTVIVVPGGPGASGPGSGDDGNGQPVGSGGLPPCTYRTLSAPEAVALGFQVPDGGGVENLPQDGTFVMRDCTASGGGRQVYFVANGAGLPAVAGLPVLTPAQLALEARHTLVLPEPEVAVNPDEVSGNPALVNLPTWWWVDNDATLTQRTEAGPVWAQVTATPFATSWIASDGSREDCASLGIAWQSWMQEDQAGSCRFTYAFASTSETATVESVWRVTWVGSGGTGGVLDLMRVSTTHTLGVYERQAIRTNN